MNPQRDLYGCYYPFEQQCMTSVKFFLGVVCPYIIIVQTTKHLKKQMSLGNQLESVPPYDITRIKCCTQRET